MVAFVVSLVFTLAFLGAAFAYSRRRPPGATLTWGEAMVASAYVFFVMFLAYGVVPLVVTLVSEGLRLGAAQRELEEVEDLDSLGRPEQVALARRVALAELGVMTVGALLILTLALRAYQTGGP